MSATPKYVLCPPTFKDTTFRLRANFKEFAVFDGRRASDFFPWSAALSIQKTDPANNNTWVVLRDLDAKGDNNVKDSHLDSLKANME